MRGTRTRSAEPPTSPIGSPIASGRRRSTASSITGWFTEDFTLAEIKTLRARERLPFRSHAYDGRFQIPTFDEVIALAQQLGAARGRPVGIYPETKHPSYFRGIKLPLEERLLASLEKKGWNTREAPVFIQSFEQDNLRELREKTRVRLVQLMATPALLTDAALADIASYADGIGPEKRLVIPVNADGSLGPPNDIIDARPRARARRTRVDDPGRESTSCRRATKAGPRRSSSSSASWASTVCSPTSRMWA